MPPLARICVPLAAAAVLLALPATTPAENPGDTPEANAAARCRLTLREQRNLGTTYVYVLRVSGTSCRNGKRLVREYHACRRRNGGRDGTCRRVLRYRCTERRYNKSRFSFDASARCKRTGREVYHRYTQNI